MPNKRSQSTKESGTKTGRARDNASSKMSEYERKRQENIQKNQELMMSLGIGSIAMDQEMQQLFQTPETARIIKKRASTGDKAPRQKKPKTPVTPRSSSRLKGIPALSPEVIEHTDFGSNRSSNVSIDKVGLMDAVEFFQAKNIQPEYVTDGHFKGWVKPDVAAKFDIEPTEEEFLAKHDVTTGDQAKKKRSTTSKRSGWSDAKSASASMLKSNPNEYFFRHCAPGEQQWMGEWEPEEIEAFLSTVKQFGCGDRWGLFSSYVPHRVGYQCANFYRQVLLTEGKIIDPNYKISSTGKAIYCGNRYKSQLNEADDDADAANSVEDRE